MLFGVKVCGKSFPYQIEKNALSSFATVKNELGVKDTTSNFLIELDLQFKTWHSRLFQGSYFNIFCDQSLLLSDPRQIFVKV